MSDEYDERRQHQHERRHDSRLSGVDRRSFLRTVAGSGYALGLASVLGVERFLSREDGTVSLTTALVRPDPTDPWTVEERTTTVPADWYATVSTALDLHRRIASVAIPGYLGSSVEPGSYGSGSATITLNVSTDDLRRFPDDLQDLLPRIGIDWDGTLDGISIDVDDVDGVEALESDPSGVSQPHLADYDDVDPVPGGVLCETDESSATLGPALYYPQVERRFFTTAHHAYGASDDSRRESLHLVFEGSRALLGRVERHYPVEDVAIVAPTGRLQPGSRVRRATTERIAGQYTLWGLADLVARDESLEKVGAMTGRTRGEIGGIDAITCFTDKYCRRGQLKWGAESDMADGDSGSISYHPNPDDVDGALVASIVNARTWWPGQNFMWGTAAYELTSEYGCHF